MRTTKGYAATQIALHWLVAALVVLRLLLRRIRGAPEAPGTGMARAAAVWGHRLLYTLLVVVPAVGGLAWFGGLRALGDPHEVLANALLVAADMR